MILKNKKLMILTSALILLPIPVAFVLQNLYPEQTAGILQVVWPVLGLLVGQWICILVSKWDPSQKGRNQKALSMVLWIIPLLSNLICGELFALLLGLDFSPYSWICSGIGLLFMVIGNYMPKTKMNATVGIKTPTTYSSEANWNATHRFAGKLWFWGGLALILGGFLPEMVAAGLMILVMGVMVVLPMVYSHRFYRKEKADGKDVKRGYSPENTKMTKKSLVIGIVILALCIGLMFVGDIEYRFEEDSLLIEASIYTDHVLKYESIEALEYREGNVPGSRTGGYGSARLLMGFFNNEEFGTYIRYTYTNPEACVVVTTQGRPLVLSGETMEDTRNLYQELKARAGK